MTFQFLSWRENFWSSALQGPLERISERIVEQNVVFHVGGGLQDFLPGQSSSASSSSPAGVHGSADGPGKGFFRAFLRPRRQLMWTRCLEWSLWPSSSSSLTMLERWNAGTHTRRRGCRRISRGFASSSPRRGIVLNNLRLWWKTVQETMMVWGDGTGCSGSAVPAVRRVLGAFGSVPRQSGGHSSCMQILGRIVRTVQQTVEISQVQFWGWLLTRLLLCNDRCPVWVAQKTVEFPQLQFWASPSSWTRLLCPLVQRLGSRNAWFDDGYM